MKTLIDHPLFKLAFISLKRQGFKFGTYFIGDDEYIDDIHVPDVMEEMSRIIRAINKEDQKGINAQRHEEKVFSGIVEEEDVQCSLRIQFENYIKGNL